MLDREQSVPKPLYAARAFSRRHFLTGAAASAGAALLAACGGSKAATDTPAPTKALAATVAPTTAAAAGTPAATAASTARTAAPAGATTDASNPSAPTTQAAIAMPKAYIGLFKDNAVAVFDTMTNKVLTTIPIPVGPHGLALTPDGRTVYASSDGATVVSATARSIPS